MHLAKLMPLGPSWPCGTLGAFSTLKRALSIRLIHLSAFGHIPQQGPFVGRGLAERTGSRLPSLVFLEQPLVTGGSFCLQLFPPINKRPAQVDASSRGPDSSPASSGCRSRPNPLARGQKNTDRNIWVCPSDRLCVHLGKLVREKEFELK